MKKMQTQCPFAFMNEPCVGKTANVDVMTIHLQQNIISGKSNSCNRLGAGACAFSCIAVFAADHIMPNTELTWHYGKEYEPNRIYMNYVCGSPCKWYRPPNNLLQRRVFKALREFGAKLPVTMAVVHAPRTDRAVTRLS